MNKSDIEFTVGLNTSPAEQQLSNLYNDVKSHNDRMQRLLANPTNFSEQKYTSDLSKLETMYGKYGNSSGTSVGNFTKSQYELFSKLIASVAKYEYEMERIAQRGSSIMSSVNTYSTNKNRVDAHPGMFDERLKSVTDMELERLEIERNKSVARGSYETWKNITSSNILALPAPEGANKTEEEKAPVDVVKNVTEENKKDNIELNSKILKWGKILATIHLVKRAISSLANIWKFGAETVTSRNTNLNQDLGYFSVDPEGALRANMDTTRAIFYAGIRNMGKNSPISKEGFDYTAQKFTDMWTAAMSGREVDARTTIDAQRLKEFFGIDLTVAGLLTGQREGKTATDVQLEVMKKVETQLTKLNEADKTTKGQVIDSLRNILGDEMVNAIVANYNKNMRGDSTATLAERVMDAGGSTLNGMDLTDKTNKAVTALASFKESLEELRNAIVVRFAPAFVSLTETITSFVDWLGKKIQTKTTTTTASPTSMGAFSSHNKIVKSTGSGNVIGNKNDRVNVINELLKSPTSAEDILNAVSLINPNVSEGTVEEGLQRQFSLEAFNAINIGYLDPNSNNPLIKALANYKYTDKKGNVYTGLEALKMAEKKGVFGKRGKNAWFRNAILGKLQEEPMLEDYQAGGKAGLKNPTEHESEEYYNRAHKAWETSFKAGLTDFYDSAFFASFAKEQFGDGGAYDFNEKVGDIFGYRLNPNYFSSPDEYYNFIANTIKTMEETGAGKEYIRSMHLPSKEELWGEDKKLQFDEVVFTLVDTQGNVLSSVKRTPTIEGYY